MPSVRLVCTVPVCGAEYYRQPSEAERSRFCSSECRKVSNILTWAKATVEARRTCATIREVGDATGVSRLVAENRLRRLPGYVRRHPILAEALGPITVALNQ